MSKSERDARNAPPPPEASLEVARNEDSMSSLLRSALKDDGKGSSPTSQVTSDILPDVQRRLREESEGRFYADGWSVEKEPPLRTFLVTSIVMCVATVLLYGFLAFPGSEPDRGRLGTPGVGKRQPQTP